jgi:hypothetical protein
VNAIVTKTQTYDYTGTDAVLKSLYTDLNRLPVLVGRLRAVTAGAQRVKGMLNEGTFEARLAKSHLAAKGDRGLTHEVAQDQFMRRSEYFRSCRMLQHGVIGPVGGTLDRIVMRAKEIRGWFSDRYRKCLFNEFGAILDIEKALRDVEQCLSGAMDVELTLGKARLLARELDPTNGAGEQAFITLYNELPNLDDRRIWSVLAIDQQVIELPVTVQEGEELSSLGHVRWAVDLQRTVADLMPELLDYQLALYQIDKINERHKGKNIDDLTFFTTPELQGYIRHAKHLLGVGQWSSAILPTLSTDIDAAYKAAVGIREDEVRFVALSNCIGARIVRDAIADLNGRAEHCLNDISERAVFQSFISYSGLCFDRFMKQLPEPNLDFATLVAKNRGTNLQDDDECAWSKLHPRTAASMQIFRAEKRPTCIDCVIRFNRNTAGSDDASHLWSVGVKRPEDFDDSQSDVFLLPVTLPAVQLQSVSKLSGVEAIEPDCHWEMLDEDLARVVRHARHSGQCDRRNIRCAIRSLPHLDLGQMASLGRTARLDSVSSAKQWYINHLSANEITELSKENYIESLSLAPEGL